MARQVQHHCADHPDPFRCPDSLVYFSSKFVEYGLIVHDGGRSTVVISFCPWCGAHLPPSQRDRWFEELKSLGIDPWEDDVPPEYQDGRWLRR